MNIDQNEADIAKMWGGKMTAEKIVIAKSNRCMTDWQIQTKVAENLIFRFRRMRSKHANVEDKNNNISSTEDFEKSVPQMAKGRLSYKMPTPRPSLTPIRKKWESLEVKDTELFQITSKTTRTLVDLN